MIESVGCCLNGTLNMTYVALFFSRYINGVAMRHGEISRGMFPRYPIRSITNGVHAATWTSSSFQALYDRTIPDWRQQNENLRYAISIPLHELVEKVEAVTVESARAAGRALITRGKPAIAVLGLGSGLESAAAIAESLSRRAA